MVLDAAEECAGHEAFCVSPNPPASVGASG